MLGLVKEINGEKTIIPLTTDTGTGAPVGTLIQQYKKKSMSGYLYCDGSTFDENAYPALYMYLGSNVLPDYSNSVENGYVYIKATSGLAENQQENVLNDVKDYIRRSNELSPIEGFTLSTTNQAAQYDGFLFVYMIGSSNIETKFYVNDEQLFIVQAPAGNDSPITIPLCKGDTIRVNRIDGGIYWTKARWYKNR